MRWYRPVRTNRTGAACGRRTGCGGRGPGRRSGRREQAMARRFTRAVKVAEILGAVAAVVVLAILFLPRLSSGGNAATPGIEQPELNVAVVPAVDSAGFFVALHQGLFAAH